MDSRRTAKPGTVALFRVAEALAREQLKPARLRHVSLRSEPKVGPNSTKAEQIAALVYASFCGTVWSLFHSILHPNLQTRPSDAQTTSTHLLVHPLGRCLTAAHCLPRSRSIPCAIWQFGVLVLLPRGSFTRTHFGSTSRTVKLRYQRLGSKEAFSSSTSSPQTSTIHHLNASAPPCSNASRFYLLIHSRYFVLTLISSRPQPTDLPWPFGRQHLFHSRPPRISLHGPPSTKSGIILTKSCADSSNWQ